MMEIKQENETKTPGSERRRDSNNNGTSVHIFPQTLDHHLHRQPSFSQGRSANPDRVTVTDATIAPISTGSNSKKASINITYRECLKNHAASIGGNVFDGCGEFLPSGEDGTIEALKCAACDCHRNFHRKEVDGETQFAANSSRKTVMLNPLQLPPPLASPTMIHHPKYTVSMHTSPSNAIVAPMNVAFGGISGGTESSSEDLNVFHSNADGEPPLPPPPYSLTKKRFRTKFTQEQKDKMMEFAEKIGWRLQKQEEEEVEKFCAEVGVKRQVFKVWMHNNKNNGKKQQPAEAV